jgi:hypothetical protein
MLIVIDIMGSGDVEIDTSKNDKKKSDKKKRPKINEVVWPTLEIVKI